MLQSTHAIRVGPRLAMVAILLAHFSEASCQFGPQRLIRQSYFSWSYRHGFFDLDNDGDLDIVLTSGVILENVGPPFKLVPTDLGGGLCEVAADIDGDGLMDLVCPTGSSGSEVVFSWRRNLGNLTFGPSQNVLGDGWANAHAQLQDMDGDGDVDVIYRESYSGYRIKSNLGGGTFGPPIQVGTVPGHSYTVIHLADMDGDGLMDILHLTAVGTSSLRRVLHNTGAFNFTETMSYSHAIGSGSENYVLSGDVTGDGRMDIIERLNSGLNYTYRKGQVDGTLSASFPLATFESHPASIAFFDVNGDGQRDLVANTSSLQTVLFSGGATAGTPISMLPPGFPASQILNWVGNLDYDSDGVEDLLVQYGNDLIAFRPNGSGGIEYAAHVLDDVRETYSSIQAADFDGDGLADVIASHFNARHFGIYRGTNGPEWPQIQLLSAYAAESERAIVLKDMDADGDPDILFTDQGFLYMLRNDGAFQFTRVALVSLNGFAVRGLSCADLDGDGDLDVIATGINRHRIIRNNGGLAFTILNDQTVLSFGCCEVITLIEDIDEDGDLDLLVNSDPTVRWIRNNGALNFGPRAFLPNNFQPYRPLFADVDGDGKKDMISRGNSLIWMRHVSGLTYDPPVTAYTPATSCYTEVLDYDNDGDLDFVGVGIGSTGGAVALNNGNGQYAALGPLTSQPWGIISSSAENMTLVHDMDGDGDTDILYLGAPIAPYGNRICWAENLAADPYQISGTVYADMDGNGSFGPPDFGLAGGTITTSPTSYVASTGQAGGYLVYGGLGNHTISAALNSPSGYWSMPPSPPSYSIDLSVANPSVAGVDFGFQPLVDTTSIVPSLMLSPGPCSGNTSLWLNLFNEGTQMAQGSLTLILDASYGFVASEPAPASVAGNVISWDFEALSPLSFMVLHLTVQLPGVGSIGQPWAHALTVEATDSFGTPIGSYTGSLQGIVACSYDPNDKLVSPAGYGIHGAIPITTDNLQYTIRFQNTGNAPAYDVMLRDELPAGIVPGSLHVAGYSHPPTQVYVNPSGELVVRFDGIQLTAAAADFIASQGFISLRFDLEEGLPNLSVLENTAEIYFDLNSPIFTNAARSTLVDCSLWLPTISAPAAGVLEVPSGDAYQWYLDGDAIPGENGPQLEVPGIGVYAALVTSIYGCTSTTPDFQVLALADGTGIPEGYRLFPNPMMEWAVLKGIAPFEEGDRLLLMDAQGRIIRDVSVGGKASVMIERTGLAQGSYTIAVRSAKRAPFVARLIVQ